MANHSNALTVRQAYPPQRSSDARRPRDLLSAIGVLGVSGGLADGRLSADEVRELVRVLAQRFAVSPRFAKSFVRRALRLIASRRGRMLLDECCRLVNEHFTEGQRAMVLTIIEEVLMADHSLHLNELIFLEVISEKLRVSAPETGRAMMVN